MEFNFKTLSCLIMLAVLHKEAAGFVKLSPKSLPLRIAEDTGDDSPFVAIDNCPDIDEDYCDIRQQEGVITAVFGIITPNDTKIDHFNFKMNFKFGNKEINLITSGRMFTYPDLEEKSNAYIPQNVDIRIRTDSEYKNLDVSKGETGTLTVTAQGVDEEEKEVALWEAIADVKAN